MHKQNKSRITAAFIFTAACLCPSVVPAQSLQQIQNVSQISIDSLNKQTGECKFHIRRNGIEMTGRVPNEERGELTGDMTVVIKNNTSNLTMMHGAKPQNSKKLRFDRRYDQIQNPEGYSAYYFNPYTHTARQTLFNAPMRRVFHDVLDACRGINIA